jgi:hypothetical protein
MKRVLTGIAVGAMALGVVSFTPDTASAKRSYGWGGWGGGPGVSIHIGPRQGYAPRYKYRNYGYRQNHWRSPYAYGPRYGYGPRWQSRQDRYYY